MWYFGTAGTPDSYNGKTSDGLMPWLKEFGLNAYEYQCGRGVRVSEETAYALNKAANENEIRLSLHAPYFISLSSSDEEKRINSINYILQSADAAERIGADRIIIHSGSLSGMQRDDAVELAAKTLKEAQEALDRVNLGHIHMCPETMGKINQLGTVEEVCYFCLLDERIIPCVDFGHLYARSHGEVNTEEAFNNIMSTIEENLGTERMRKIHIHFSHIEFTDGGEKKHLNFEDGLFGPDFEPLCKSLLSFGAEPVIISESAGKQAEDALYMRNCYNEYSK